MGSKPEIAGGVIKGVGSGIFGLINLARKGCIPVVVLTVGLAGVAAVFEVHQAW